MDWLWRDLRFSIRRLLKNPGFTLIVVLTLALGVGANSAILSVVNGFLLRPLPYQEPDELVLLFHHYPSLNDLFAPVSPAGFLRYQEQNQVFSSVAVATNSGVTLTGESDPQRVSAEFVSGKYFDTFGVPALRGRTLLPEEDQPGREQVVVLEHGFWQRVYGGDPGVVGQELELDGTKARIVGIMPPSFRSFFGDVDLWKPLALTPEQAQSGGEYLSFTGRLREGISLERAEADLAGMTQFTHEEFPNVYPPNWRLSAQTLNERSRGNVRPALLMLLGAVGFVMLIACTNVASLLLAQTASRQRELALRQALGAKRGTLIRQLLCESLVLALFGGIVGFPLAYLGMQTFIRSAASQFSGQVLFDGKVVAFTALISVVGGLLAGLVPALVGTRADLNQPLREGGRGVSGDRRSGLVRHALVVAEMAMAMVLLIGAGLLIKSFFLIQGVDPGFRVEQLLTGSISLPQSKYPEPSQQLDFFDRLQERLAGLPGVEKVGATSVLPFGGSWSTMTFTLEGHEVQPGQPAPWGDIRIITPDFLESLGVRLLKGRSLEQRDGPDNPRVALVDQELATQYWPDQDPIGKRLMTGFRPSPTDQDAWIEIVGVVDHTMHEGLDADSRIQVYLPFRQNPRRSMTLALRTQREPKTVASGVRQAVLELDPALPFSRVLSMEELVASSLGSRRFLMLLLTVFSAVALLLAVVGIYGVMSYSVTQRSQELGVRLALGADRGRLLVMVLHQALKLTTLGSLFGLAASLALSRLVEGQLYGVGSTDPLTYLMFPLALLLSAVVATLQPALRATRVDPATTLRGD